MSPLRMRARRDTRSAVLLVAVGAVTGLAVGVMLADRAGGLSGLLQWKPNRDLEGRGDSESRRGIGTGRARGGPESNAQMDEDRDASVAAEGYTAEREVPDDTELEERVLEAFHNDPVLSERAIDIGAIGTGVIELTGWVQASWEIGHAVTLARGVPDVSTVVDRLAVRDGERRRDHSGRRYAGDAGGSESTAADDAPQGS